jgi:phenylalanyl-tRNA synthetase beta subunit
MRQTLIWGGLETIAYNINRQQYDLRFFEQAMFTPTFHRPIPLKMQQKVKV